MLNQSERHSLVTASSKAELKNRANKIKESIDFTFGPDSQSRETIIKELETFVEQISKTLPDISAKELETISANIEFANNQQEIREYIKLLTTQYQAPNPEIREAIVEGKGRWNRRKLELEKEKEELEKKKIKQEILEQEFQLLVEEMKPKEFKTSSEVSKHIMKNNLASKYKNISGILELADGWNPWDFHGGISPQYYARLCEELGLGQKKSNATVESFTSFEDLKQAKNIKKELQ